MNLKQFLRSQAYNSWLASVVAARISRVGTPIFMFHHTLPKGSDCFDAGMDTEAGLFDRFVTWLKHQYRVVPLTEIATAGAPIENACAITIDDGWWDTYEYTFPILKKHEVPATVFLPVDYIGTNRQFWQDSLWDIHRQLATSQRWGELYHAARGRYSWWPKEDRKHTFNGVVALLSRRSMAEADEVVAWCLDAFRLVPGLRSPAFLAWNQVHEMQAGGVEFGSHTNSHLLLTQVSDARARDEIVSSKRRLEEILKKPVTTFCYPAGRHNGRLAEMARDAGYVAAVTDAPRLATRQDSQWMLPRVGVSSLTLTGEHDFNPNALRLQLARAGVRARLFSPRATWRG